MENENRNDSSDDVFLTRKLWETRLEGCFFATGLTRTPFSVALGRFGLPTIGFEVEPYVPAEGGVSVRQLFLVLNSPRYPTRLFEDRRLLVDTFEDTTEARSAAHRIMDTIRRNEIHTVTLERPAPDPFSLSPVVLPQPQLRTPGARVRRFAFAGLAAIGAVVLIISLLGVLTSKPNQPMPMAQAETQSGQSDGAPAQAPARRTQPLSVDEVTALDKSPHFDLGPKGAAGAPLRVVMDPLCPACKSAWPAVQQYSETHPVRVFPAPIVGGGQSVKLVMGALCESGAFPNHKQDMTAGKRAWGDAMTTGVFKANESLTIEQYRQCTEQAVAAARVAVDLHMTATPTFIAPNGALQVPAGGAPVSAGAIGTWLRSNS